MRRLSIPLIALAMSSVLLSQDWQQNGAASSPASDGQTTSQPGYVPKDPGATQQQASEAVSKDKTPIPPQSVPARGDLQLPAYQPSPQPWEANQNKVRLYEHWYKNPHWYLAAGLGGGGGYLVSGGGPARKVGGGVMIGFSAIFVYMAVTNWID